MKKKSASKSAFFKLRLVIGVLLCFAAIAIVVLAQPRPVQSGPATAGQPLIRAQYRGLLPVVKFDISPPLRDMKPLKQHECTLREDEERGTIPAGPVGQVVPDPVVQRVLGKIGIPGPIISFDAYTNMCGCQPPDPNGAVGPNHVVVIGNLHFQIFNKSGVSLFGPVANNTLWSGFGGPCQTENAGDPVAVYDQLADRWLLAQFTSAGPTYFECVAVSQTNDPTLSYFRYAISTGTNFPDYPKGAIWPDAYYFSTREFAGANFAGVGAYALNRADAIGGVPNPRIISFLAPPNPLYAVGDGLLPSNLDGMTQPPVGSPNYYLGTQDNNGPYGAPNDAINLWKFHADFINPPNSTFTLTDTLPTDPFNSILALCGGSRACIPQPGTSNRIDHLGYRQRPTFRNAYRNFGSHESLVTNQSVSAGTGPNGEVSGVRWYELRSPNSGPVIFQQGTYAPGLSDGIHRWMGSIAMNSIGDMALGFSAANGTSPSVFPSVYYTGRHDGDPPGQMTLGEGSIINGPASQTSGNRWGDYTSLVIDPVDDMTFWYINQYLPTNGAAWRIRVGAFNLAGASPSPTPTASPTPTPTATSTPAGCDTGLIQNEGFETGSFPPWVIDGHVNDPVVGTDSPHTGNNAAFAGGNPQQNTHCEENNNEPLGDSSFYQQFGPVPAGSTLSFWHKDCTNDSISFDWQDAYITDSNGNILQTIYHLCDTADYTNVTVDMTPYVGQTVRIKFLTHQDGFNPPGDTTGQWIDDVALLGPCGTATPSPTVTPAMCSWSAGPPLPTVLIRAVGVYFPDGNFYTVGGRTSDTAGSDFQHVLKFNTMTNTWSQQGVTLPDNTMNNMACGVLSLGGSPKIYCVGGSAAGQTMATARVFYYDPATDIATTLTSADNWPGDSAGTILPGGFAETGNKMYILGGFNINVASTNGIYAFDPNGAVGAKWTTSVHTTPEGIMYAPTCAINGIIYVGGASDYSGGTVIDTTNSFSYNPSTDTLGTIAPIPRATGETRGLNFCNRMYVMGGGRVAPNPSSEVDVYDPVSNTWSLGMPFMNARRNFPADTDGTNNIWLVGGYEPSAPAADLEIYHCPVSPCGGVSPTPTATATPVVSATPTATATATATATFTPTPTPTPRSTPTPRPVPTPRMRPTPPPRP